MSGFYKGSISSYPGDFKYSEDDYTYITILYHSDKSSSYTSPSGHKFDDLYSIIIGNSDDKLLERFRPNVLAKIKLYKYYDMLSPNRLENSFNSKSSHVKLISDELSSIQYMYLTNTRNYPITIEQLCRKIIDSKYGEDYICRPDYILQVK